MESNIKNHYNSDHLVQNIQRALERSGKDMSTIETKDLYSIDQLHTGGARASIQLFKKLNLHTDARVLDAGCGIGGSSRLLAELFNCHVTGIDLADRFIQAAIYLTRLTRQDIVVDFRQGSILDLPFENNIFDIILCQHVLMNIKDKSSVVKEFFRVLKPGGKLILHEITQGENNKLPLIFPVPWAGNSAMSFIDSWDNLSVLFDRHGFKTDFCADETRKAAMWWEKVKAFSQKKPPRTDSLGPGLIFGASAKLFGTNMYANFQNNSICLIEAILKKI